MTKENFINFRQSTYNMEQYIGLGDNFICYKKRFIFVTRK